MGDARTCGASLSSYIEVQLKRVRIDRGDRTVLRDVDWRIRPGERWVLLGHNGSGKTQLLKLLAGDVWPTPTGQESRRYRWRGKTWTEPHSVKDEIAYLGAERQDKYERYGWNQSVEQVVGTGLYRTDIPLDPLTRQDRRRIAMLLRRSGNAQLAGRRMLTLSYGERRLVLLARALATRPKLLLLDEPFNGLDESHRARASRWLENTARSGLPWVLATHRAEDIPGAATHVLMLGGGRIVYRGVRVRASVTRWLTASQASPNTISRRPRRAIARKPLVRLVRASVYLDTAIVLRGISLELRAGDCWVVHGPNGAGKTTLLRAIYGDHPLGGRIERAGIGPGVPLERFRRRVGWIAPHLHADHPDHLTVAEVVQSGRYASIGLNDAPTAVDRAASRSALAFFGLLQLRKYPLRELSYGQVRRVLFARAWVSRSSLLLLDEPFSGLDAATRGELLERIDELIDQGVAVLVATHSRHDWPRRATHELSLRSGRVLYCGPIRPRT